MMILAIDPGPEKSAWVLYVNGRVQKCGINENDDLRDMLTGEFMVNSHYLAIEMVQSFGMAVGREVFETVFWVGRFWECWPFGRALLYRRDIKLHLCNSVRAKDANVRAAIINRFGGKSKAIGNRKKPGPLYGITSHMWSALAVGITFEETRKAA